MVFLRTIRQKTSLAVLCVLSTVLFFSPAVVHAAFDPNFLLSDYDLTDGGALSRKGVQAFLAAKGSGLTTRTFTALNRAVKSAADIIFEVSRQYSISQKFLLVLLQKEQSLITDPTPSERQLDWATGFAVCDSCSTSDPSLQRFRGYANQVTWAAKRIRETYLPLLEKTGRVYQFGRGISTMIDGVSVTPRNNATAALYTYTPHLHGNQNFVRLWNAWFARRFPDGALVKNTEGKGYYLIAAGKRRPFRSTTVLLSNYDPKKALLASPNDLAAYELGEPIVFQNYSLIRSPRGTIFLIVDGTKRGIASQEVFRTLGFNPEEVQNAKWGDINLYPDGPILDLSSAYPAGALLQSTTTGGITYVEQGIRHAIHSKEILTSRFAGKKIIRVSEREVDQYPAGDPVTFRDGEVITAKGERSVYFISNGQKRPIASREAFTTLGLKWSNVIRTTQRALEIHPTGEPVGAITDQPAN